MDASGDGPRPLTTELRVVLWVFLGLAALAFNQLYVLSGRTDELFAWTIKPDITAAFLGAGCVLVAFSLRRRPWAEVRTGVPVVLVFAALFLVMTLLHLDRFHFGPDNGFIARFAAWVFLIVYVLVPTVGTWLFVREARLAGPQPPGAHDLPRWLEAVLGVQGGLLTLYGLALFVAPATFGPAWPWALSPLSGRAVAGWLVPIGLASLAVLREDDLRRARGPAITSVVYGLLQLGALARYGDQVQWSEPGAWVWLAVLASVIGTGAYSLLAIRGEPGQHPLTATQG